MKYLPLNWDRVASEPVRDEYLIFVVFIACGQNIGALKSLVEVSEDVEYRDEALGGVRRTSHICIDGLLARNRGRRRAALTSFLASEVLVRALGDIS